MKKFLSLLIISLFLVTGCYDNVELNKLSMVSGIGIDYKDNNFVITYEIYNDNKSENTGELLSDTISGKGSTISEAFYDANNKTNKKDFFAHLKLVILSESLIKEHLKEITDYLIRDTDIRDEFYLLVSNNSPEEILKHINTKHPVASDYIVKLLSNEKYNNVLPTQETYQNILSKLVGGKTDIVLNSISIIDDKLSLNNSYMFKNYDYKTKLSLKDSALYSMLAFNNAGIEYKKTYNNEIFAISISKAKNDIKVKNNELFIKLSLEAKVIENNSNLDLKNTNTYKKLNKDFNKIIKEDIINFIKLLQENNCDVLGFQDIYYKTYNKNNYNLWSTSNINVEVNTKINYKGFIFEVK